MKAASILSMLLLIGGNANAQNVTGNDLHEACNDDGLAQLGFCTGYIVGAVEGMRWGIAVPQFLAGETDVEKVNHTSNILLQICEPEGVVAGQYRDVAIEYLRRNPAMRHHPARGLIQNAMVEAFPCN